LSEKQIESILKLHRHSVKARRQNLVSLNDIYLCL